MKGWSAAGVKTERVTVGEEVVEAPLVLMESGEILPMILQFPDVRSGEGGELGRLRESATVAETLISSMDAVLTAATMCERLSSKRDADELITPAFKLLSDAISLHKYTRRDDEVKRLCVLINRQLRMGLLALTLRRAVLRRLKVNDPRIFYRKLTRSQRFDQDGACSDDNSGRRQFITQWSRQYKRGRSKRPKQGHVLEFVQAAAQVGMRALQFDQEDMLLGREKEAALEFFAVRQCSERLDELCEGQLPEDHHTRGSTENNCCAGSYYGDEPHVCCTLPPMDPPADICCATEIHNLSVTRWEPWGTEEKSAIVAISMLLLDRRRACERMICYGLTPAAHVQLQGGELNRD